MKELPQAVKHIVDGLRTVGHYEYSRQHASELQPRDLFVGGYDFVAHLHHELKAEIGFFYRDQGGVHVRSVSRENSGDLGLGLPFELLHIVKRAVQDVPEARSAGACRMQRCRVQFGGQNAQRGYGTAHLVFSEDFINSESAVTAESYF